MWNPDSESHTQLVTVTRGTDRALGEITGCASLSGVIRWWRHCLCADAVLCFRRYTQVLTAASTLISQEADGLILINIDNGSVTHSGGDGVDIPDIPLLAAQTFIQR